ncbi:hypothetical protein, partial [Rhizobium sp. TRM95796]|uniref:hypothetical protein n=1 Tax=Rhizobium sp. TRM95796 TaxID=2979862 RepID=UPI0021E9785E
LEATAAPVDVPAYTNHPPHRQPENQKQQKKNDNVLKYMRYYQPVSKRPANAAYMPYIFRLRLPELGLWSANTHGVEKALQAIRRNSPRPPLC